MLRGCCEGATNFVEKFLGRELLVVLGVLAVALPRYPCCGGLLHLTGAAVIRYG